MAINHALDTDESAIPAALRRFLWNRIQELAGLVSIGTIFTAGMALATWSADDPAFNHATGTKPLNKLGLAGSYFADFLIQPFGLAVVVVLFVPLAWALPLLRHQRTDGLKAKLAWWLLSAISLSLALACLPHAASWPLIAGLGGYVGEMALGGLLSIFAIALKGVFATALVFISAAAIFATALPLSMGFELATYKSIFMQMGGTKRRKIAISGEDRPQARKATLLVVLAALLARFKPADSHEEAEASDDAGADSLGRFRPISLRQPQAGETFAEDEAGEVDEVEEPTPVAKRAAKPAPRVKPKSAKTKFVLPDLDFLAEPKKVGRVPELSKEQLEDNARRLESVLQDFGVEGQIIAVRPGPVVTLYELEPAPGIKSSRVISLADDIARSMSAISARVAVVSGRNAIGIELPNPKRETVYVREMFAEDAFINNHTNLTVALGKNIGGDPVYADLAKMPHLLIAGTTGSGKSVGINTMILSLLYRLPPDKCKLIMIDPKMLELSVYEGIPHLLSPVVTDPRKAVVALKWAVREMEERYKKMSKCGVRNVDGYNTKVAQILAKGGKLERTVQTGFDADTGEPVFEQEEMDLAPMPYIVVIIDEMADLMMVAGKDIEGAVQRLAQMARAAGIHVVMATQRPSVDVITGTIKANFPTRISFQVTSKIDSRTILGEQGAEQLLGQGDMLYMAGGGRISRLHAPFVSDSEVEEIVNHLKSQGAPEYLEAVTEEQDDESDSGAGFGAGGGSGDNLYDQAVQVVLRDKKVSTSYVQRRLGVGYNKAATLIERMEQEGVISAPNGQGKREILVPGDSAR